MLSAYALYEAVQGIVGIVIFGVGYGVGEPMTLILFMILFSLGEE